MSEQLLISCVSCQSILMSLAKQSTLVLLEYFSDNLMIMAFLWEVWSMCKNPKPRVFCESPLVLPYLVKDKDKGQLWSIRLWSVPCFLFLRDVGEAKYVTALRCTLWLCTPKLFKYPNGVECSLFSSNRIRIYSRSVV